MGTRSTITIKLGKDGVPNRWEGKYYSVYCHWDGYVSHNGRILVEHYNNYDKAHALIQLGGISSLAPSIEKPDGHSFDSPVEGYTTFYGRDRGESDMEPTLYSDWEEVVRSGESYNYLFDNGVWYVQDSTNLLRPVVSILAGIEDDEAKLNDDFNDDVSHLIDAFTTFQNALDNN
jgi:hypothetical protein